MPRAAPPAEDAVTPVIGTVMILGITVLGIGAIMLWGAPTLQAIQDRNALTAMEGEMLEIRTGTLDLTIDKASRLPEVVVEAGELSIERGTRFLLSHSEMTPGCDVHFTGWNSGTSNHMTVTFKGCAADTLAGDCGAAGGDYCILVQRSLGTSLVSQSTSIIGGAWPSYTVAVGGVDLQAGDWVFRIRDRSIGGEPVVAQAWLLSTNRISWDLHSSVSDIGAVVEAGAVFERNGPKVFLLKSPEFQESSSGLDDYFIRMPSYIGDTLGSVSARASVNIFIGQVGNNHLRTSTADATSLRFDFTGDLAEAWCESLLFRNAQLSTATYTEAVDCTDPVPSVTYKLDSNTAFSYELFHARITARIQN